MGAIGKIGINGHNAFMNMLKNLPTSKQDQFYLEKKLISICIHTHDTRNTTHDTRHTYTAAHGLPHFSVELRGNTYYIFCTRDSEWTSPELLIF